MNLVIWFFVVFLLIAQTEQWRRRRRRRCNTTPCRVGNWRPFGHCSQPCGRLGRKTRTRDITQHPGQCGARCPPLSETVPCNTALIYCHSRGTVQDYGCACLSPYTGRCCEYIKCQEAICNLQPWSTWADMSPPVNGHCASQSRRQRYKRTWRLVVRTSCSGLRQTCNKDIIATREKVVHCQPLRNPALGVYIPARCTSQKTKCKETCQLTCSGAHNLVLVGTSAQARRKCQANRHWSILGAQCKKKCREAVCTLQPWSTWTDTKLPLNGHCASQSRRRTYKKTWRTVIQSSCSSLTQTCNTDIVATREKIVYCQPLSSPSLGSYDPPYCTSKIQRCRQICILICQASNGLSLVGSSAQARRECQASGRWSDLKAHCKDVQRPSITCPSNMVVNNDKGKDYAKVHLPSPLSLNDNSGVQPVLTALSSKTGFVQDLLISSPTSSGTKITYTATDGAGLKASCSYYIKVKDVEKPKVISCPLNVTKETSEQKTRVYWTTPTFQDNYKEKPPVITSSIAPGATFHWGTTVISYTATDIWGNTAQCQFPVNVKPPSCPLYDPPVNGARTCNIRASGVVQELICTVQCNENFDFNQSSPWYAYVCSNHGVWHGYRQHSFVSVVLPQEYGRPWTDCTLQSVSNGPKNATVYSGSCLSSGTATKQQLRQNFLNTIIGDPFLDRLLCKSNKGNDCTPTNVKIYCGQNSRK